MVMFCQSTPHLPSFQPLYQAPRYKPIQASPHNPKLHIQVRKLGKAVQDRSAGHTSHMNEDTSRFTPLNDDDVTWGGSNSHPDHADRLDSDAG
ncbi:hypothetical protein VTL71DRAFT_15784, partial [Oculimacula yallundae]